MVCVIEATLLSNCAIVLHTKCVGSCLLSACTMQFQKALDVEMFIGHCF